MEWGKRQVRCHLSLQSPFFLPSCFLLSFFLHGWLASSSLFFSFIHLPFPFFLSSPSPPQIFSFSFFPFSFSLFFSLLLSCFPSIFSCTFTQHLFSLNDRILKQKLRVTLCLWIFGYERIKIFQLRAYIYDELE